MPATYQGTLFRAAGDPIVDLQPPDGMTVAQQRARLDTLATLNELDMAKHPGNSELAARISSYELAYRMQGCAPEAVDTAAESDATKKLYGLDEKITEPFRPTVSHGAPPRRNVASASCSCSTVDSAYKTPTPGTHTAT